MPKVVVVGAGVGGLASAAVLSRLGYDVTVLEAHIYPGGCAGTFFHQGYHFDAGATLAGGFYPGGPMDILGQLVGIANWPIYPYQPALQVHMPDGSIVNRWGDDRRFAEHRSAFGKDSDKFFSWQERTADVMWRFALMIPPWPPQDPKQVLGLLNKGALWMGSEWRSVFPSVFLDAFQPLGVHLRNMPENLRIFIDGQLLISAQATSAKTNALYGASALDLPRRGVVHLQGGMGSIADTIVKAIQKNGGRVFYRNQVTRVVFEKGNPSGVEVKRGGYFDCDILIMNLSPWNIASLMGEDAPMKLRKLPQKPQTGWGAFMVYLGIDGSAIPPDFPLHHQVISREPMGEGNTIFMSLSPAWDDQRAPSGHRALTISTHTKFEPWWDLYDKDRTIYETRKNEYTQKILDAASRVIPLLREASTLILPGTPVTFERFTHRTWGWVGGFPQINLFQGWAPRLGERLWMVGDSIFPGQSTAAVALGGIRVANDIHSSVA